MTTDASPEIIGQQADEITERLARGEQVWAETSLAQRRELLGRLKQLTAVNASEWVQAAARIKQLPADSPLIGEEWISGPWAVLGPASALARTLSGSTQFGRAGRLPHPDHGQRPARDQGAAALRL